MKKWCSQLDLEVNNVIGLILKKMHQIDNNVFSSALTVDECDAARFLLNIYKLHTHHINLCLTQADQDLTQLNLHRFIRKKSSTDVVADESHSWSACNPI